MAQYCKLFESIEISTVSTCENSAVVHKDDTIVIVNLYYCLNEKSHIKGRSRGHIS